MAGLLGCLDDPEEKAKTAKKKLMEMAKKELPIKSGITVDRLCRRFGLKNHFVMADAIGELEIKGDAFLSGFEHAGLGTMYPKYSNTPKDQE